MNKLQLTKGELTKIILEEVRKLNEQDDDFAQIAMKKVADAAKVKSSDKATAADVLGPDSGAPEVTPEEGDPSPSEE